MTLVVAAEDMHAQTNLTLLILVMTFIVSANSTNKTSRNEDLVVAIQEMQTATYFSFVMLINMYPPDRIPRNITFLIPNDRMLSQISLPEDSVYKFLLRHSIPSPLLFDHLQRFPTGSMVPTSEPEFMLRVFNNGRRNFYLNNAQIISPNICSPPNPKTSAAPVSPKDPTAPDNPKRAAAAASPTFPSPSLPPVNAPPPINVHIGSKKSDSSQLVDRGFFPSMVPCMILALVTVQILL